MTNSLLRALGLGVVAGTALFLPRRDAAANVRTTPNACMSDSSFQRLAFWIGDWDVFDSTGTRYASQRVRCRRLRVDRRVDGSRRRQRYEHDGV
jgi:hypothetical protein